MLTAIFILLLLFWLLGYLQVPLFHVVLFQMGRRAVFFNDLLILLVILWLINLLSSPFREVAGVLLFLWVLSKLGIITIAGFSNVVLLVVIIALFAYLFRGRY